MDGLILKSCTAAETGQGHKLPVPDFCLAAVLYIPVCVQVLSNRGLNCFVSLPYLQRLSLSHCPAVTGCGLASFLLSASSSMRHVDLLCCAGVRPAEAQAVQDAVWSITHRRVDVSWSRHDTMQARF